MYAVPIRTVPPRIPNKQDLLLPELLDSVIPKAQMQAMALWNDGFSGVRSLELWNLNCWILGFMELWMVKEIGFFDFGLMKCRHSWCEPRQARASCIHIHAHTHVHSHIHVRIYGERERETESERERELYVFAYLYCISYTISTACCYHAFCMSAAPHTIQH